MPEREFELYLSLLSRFLRLDPAQREQVADELRDHFDERFEELLQSGLTREEAIGATLEEFGDAAGLAADFSHIGNRRRRRIIMRCTVGTAAGLVAAVFLAAIFWPEGPAVQGPVGRAVAQQPAQPQGAGTAATKPLAGSAVEAKLAARVPEVNFVETPLKEVIEFLSDANEVDILVSKHALESLSVSLDAPITLQVKHTAVSVKTALELALEQVSGELSYTVRDGLVYITQKYDNDEIQVYNVRDLLKDFPLALSAGGIGGEAGAGLMGGSFRGMPGGGPGMAGMPGGEGGFGGAMGGGGLGGAAGNHPAAAGDALLNVITSTIYPDTWTDVGGSGSLAEFNGLLIVKQSQTVHRQISLLLDMMREVEKQATPAPAAGRRQ